jgi:murein DD-endopeptidase MepM/ murein hydrolase activator NlpD
LSERAPGGRFGLPGRHRLAAVGIAAVVAAVVIAVSTSTSTGPVRTVGDVAGAVPSPPPVDVAGVPGRAATAPTSRMDATIERPAAPPPVVTLAGYRWPLARARITLPFGPSPWGSRIVQGKHFHDGVDMATFCGDRIVAAHGGTVLAAGRRYDKMMGWVGDLTPYLDRLEKKDLWGTLPIVIVIDDGNGYRSMYAHFQKVVVKVGATVKAGQLIGYEGRTGRASGCHLHYGLFSPLEAKTFGIDATVVKHMKLPAHQIARIDPLKVLPKRSKAPAGPADRPTPHPSPGEDGP